MVDLVNYVAGDGPAWTVEPGELELETPAVAAGQEPPRMTVWD